MTLTLIALSLSVASLAVSTGALFAMRRTSGPSLLRKHGELCARLERDEAELTYLSTELLSALKRERARANMARLRANRKATEADEPEGSSANGGLNDRSAASATEADKDEWQRQANLDIAAGKYRGILPR